MKKTKSMGTAPKVLLLCLVMLLFNISADAQTTVNTSGGDFSSLMTWVKRIFSGLIALWFIYMIGAGIFKLSGDDSGGRGKTQIVIGVVGLVLWKLADTFLQQLA